MHLKFRQANADFRGPRSLRADIFMAYTSWQASVVFVRVLKVGVNASETVLWPLPPRLFYNFLGYCTFSLSPLHVMFAVKKTTKIGM